MIESYSARFWSKVRKGNPDDCWLWTAYRNAQGYGTVRMGPMVLSHRVAYELTFGAIPAGLLVLHRCDVPACCNPAHLFLGTNQDNTDDMVGKGRAVHPDNSGEKNPHSKLTAAQVADIRRRYAFRGIGGDSGQALADEFGVGKQTISKILRGVSWSLNGGSHE